MNLQEYLNQKDPVKMPTVNLESTDYRIMEYLPSIGMSVIIIAGVEHEYVVKDGDPLVFTTDEYGNPKNRSCFRIRRVETFRRKCLNIMRRRVKQSGQLYVMGNASEIAEEMNNIFDFKVKVGKSSFMLVPDEEVKERENREFWGIR